MGNETFYGDGLMGSLIIVAVFGIIAALGSVRIVKNCDLGRENATRGRRACGLGQHFQALGHSFSPYGLPSRQMTCNVHQNVFKP